jgi:hypothetical protein
MLVMHQTAVKSLGTLAMVLKEDAVIGAFAHYLSWDHLPGQSSNKHATQLSPSAIVLLLGHCMCSPCTWRSQCFVTDLIPTSHLHVSSSNSK